MLPSTWMKYTIKIIIYITCLFKILIFKDLEEPFRQSKIITYIILKNANAKSSILIGIYSNESMNLISLSNILLRFIINKFHFSVDTILYIVTVIIEKMIYHLTLDSLGLNGFYRVTYKSWNNKLFNVMLITIIGSTKF
jgi:hypothetical protein